jgi:hypothetical protein
LVRIQQRTAKRRYMHRKRVYAYTRQSVCILKEFHAVTEQFLKQDLAQNVSAQADSLVITLSPKKNA